jgi:hypothetical protein
MPSPVPGAHRIDIARVDQTLLSKRDLNSLKTPFQNICIYIGTKPIVFVKIEFFVPAAWKFVQGVLDLLHSFGMGLFHRTHL